MADAFSRFLGVYLSLRSSNHNQVTKKMDYIYITYCITLYLKKIIIAVQLLTIVTSSIGPKNWEENLPWALFLHRELIVKRK